MIKSKNQMEMAFDLAEQRKVRIIVKAEQRKIWYIEKAKAEL